jgi:glycosyltransferase involved in cell wall biosynthesis
MSLELNERVKFHGLVRDGDKEQEFFDADVVVVPSFKEAFCLVVAESLAHGVPVIAATGTPWQRLGTVGCGMWVDNAPETLARAIEMSQHMPLREMGALGREWMQREYSWSGIADATAAEYRRLIRSYEGSPGAVKDSKAVSY